MPKSHHRPPGDFSVMDIRSAFKAWNRNHQDLSPAVGGQPLIDGQLVLTRARGLFPILDIFADANPIAKVVVSTFKVLITFEAERRENKARVVIVLLAQTEMMSAFLEIYALHPEHPNPYAKLSQSQGFYEGLLERGVTVKFIKASEWKDTLLEYIQKFEGYRSEILLMLSLRTAEALIREDWERKLESRIAGLDASTLVPNNPRNVDALSALKDSIHTSLDALCNRNSEIFYRKLDLQMERLEYAVEMSAKYVVRELSGPYDRLQDEDLRELWKEMGWVFCVESQQFAQALSPSSDAWTLQYLSTHARQISRTIDSDGSGYIRISEANAFTSKMPDGWTLPQWCCYAALGTPDERSIYRDRINSVIDRLMLEQIRVKCDNLAHYAMFINGETIGALSLLARGPSPKLDPDAPWRALAQVKINQQDERLRNDLLSLKFNIDAAETIHLLCGGVPVEDCILQLATLLLEHCLEVAQCCSRNILDTLEFSMLWDSFSAVKNKIDRRIEELKATFSKQDPNPAVINKRLEDHSGGIFRVYHHSGILALELEAPDTLPIWDTEEVASRLTAIVSKNRKSGDESPSKPNQ
ncbi:hypothetical protein BD779DRAFT_1678108 [Infundibulicybe gibba]|nr:hypothetical protein BD779DRAFT_1678108 [Infundibulicybe gibba]